MNHPSKSACGGEKVWYLLAFIVLIAAVYFRFVGLERESLWIDEGYTYVVSLLPPAALMVPFDVHPPLYYIITGWFIEEGSSEWWIRVPSAIAGVITVGLLFWMAARWYGTRGAFVATALLALSYTHLAYSTNARSYSLLLLLLLVSMWSFLSLYRHIEQGEWPKPRVYWLWATYLISAIINLYVHDLAAIYLAVFNLTAFGFAVVNPLFRKRRLFMGYVVTHVVMFVAWVPWLLIAFESADNFNWLIQYGLVESIRQALTVIMPGDMPKWIQAPFALIVAASVYISLRHGDTRMRILIISCLLLVPLTVYLIGFLKPLFMEKTILPMLFAEVLAIGYAIQRWKIYRWHYVVMAFLIGIQGVSAYLYQTRSLERTYFESRLTEDFRTAIQKADDVVVMPLAHITAPYYVRENQQLYLFRDNALWPFDMHQLQAYTAFDPADQPQTFPTYLSQLGVVPVTDLKELAGKSISMVDRGPEKHAQIDAFLTSQHYQVTESFTPPNMIVVRYQPATAQIQDQKE
jgi:uncharacterized membrane protein